MSQAELETTSCGDLNVSRVLSSQMEAKGKTARHMEDVKAADTTWLQVEA